MDNRHGDALCHRVRHLVPCVGRFRFAKRFVLYRVAGDDLAQLCDHRTVDVVRRVGHRRTQPLFRLSRRTGFTSKQRGGAELLLRRTAGVVAHPAGDLGLDRPAKPNRHTKPMAGCRVDVDRIPRAADADRAVVLPTVQNRQARPSRPNGSKGLADDRHSAAVVCMRDSRFRVDSARRLLHVGALRRALVVNWITAITALAADRR